MKRLEKCPCCGSDVAFVGTVAEIDYVECDEDIPVWAEEHWTVVCDYLKGGCGASTSGRYKTPEEAIAAWNGRPSKIIYGSPETDLAGKKYEVRSDG